jgi:isopentenyldiphosphate isomerase
VQQNDPAELLEIFDASGRPTGRASPRGAIHLNGDWHQAFHCWIVRDAGREVVLQRRAFEKDTFAGCWDAAAAGHWRFGESPEEAAREIAEELGVSVDFAELAYRGRERAARRFPNGLIDREFHQVYVLDSSLPLVAFKPEPREVIGLAAFPTDGLLELVAGTRAGLAASESVRVDADGTVHADSLVVGREDLVPYSLARLRRMLGRRGAR